MKNLKNLLKIMVVFLMSCLLSYSVEASTFVSGSTGADGAFNPPTQVPPGTVVDTINFIVSVPLPPNGIFNFTTVDIPTGMTVKFMRNMANTSVYILTSDDVNISGVIDVSGVNGADGGYADGVKVGPIPGGIGGPGGFDGGFGGEPTSPGILAKTPGFGLGPGGGSLGHEGCFSTGDAFPYVGYWAGPCYGNESIQPLIGGSGGSGGSYCSGYPGCFGGGGGGGGGALLIASSGLISVKNTGEIRANGGAAGGGNGSNPGYFGSGGAVKLIANKIYMYGQITALGHVILPKPVGCPGGFCDRLYTYMHGQGRIRIEAYYYAEGAIYPSPSLGLPGVVFLLPVPSLSITSIAGVVVPVITTGSYATPDISLPATITNPISISVSAANIPVGTIITVTAVPQSDSPSSATATLAGTDTSSTATASLSISTTYPSVITAQTTFNIQTAMYYDGEKIDKVKIASKLAGPSNVTYITKSGKEIPAATLLAGLLK